MADGDGKAVEDDVVERGVQGDGGQDAGVILEVCHTLYVGFQCVDSWNKEVNHFSNGLEWLV